MYLITLITAVSSFNSPVSRGESLDMPHTLKKTILIAGASGGMGRALVELLRASGANLILVDRERKKTKMGESASVQEFHGIDMADYDAVRRLASTMRRKRIKVDWIINLVGYADRAGALN